MELNEYQNKALETVLFPQCGIGSGGQGTRIRVF